jgi:hypothetical protein
MELDFDNLVRKYGPPDDMGHITRFSDSSLYDEICVVCGLTDGAGWHVKSTIDNTRCTRKETK